MEDRLRRRIREMSAELAVAEKEKFEAAGTFVDLERLTVEIGDELTRQLTGLLLSSRAQEAAQQPVHACGECGRECPLEEMEPLILQGLRGEIEYSEPKCYCPQCRRAFFPGGAPTSASAS